MITTVVPFDDSVKRRFQSGDKYVVVEQSPEYPGHLLFQAWDQVKFTKTYQDYLSRFSLLKELFMLEAFVSRLEHDGWEIVFLDDCQSLLEDHARWDSGLVVDGLVLPNGLFPFQQYTLNRSMERIPSAPKVSGFFYNFSPGSGKGTVAAGGAQELVANRGQIDLVIFFTLRKMKINMARRVEQLTDLSAKVVEGSPQLRERRYLAGDAEVFVMNYEKAHFDLEVLSALVADKSVLFILDEVQKVLFAENMSPTRSRKGLDKLVRACRKATVWTMSGSIVKQSPVRYHDVYRVQEMRGRNPLGSKDEFIQNFSKEVDHVKSFGGKTDLKITWDPKELSKVPHLVSHLTQAVRKTDPGVREFFKGMTTEIIPIQMSTQDRRLYSEITADAIEHANDRSKLGQYFRLLRYVCNTPEALTRSASPLAQQYVDQFPDVMDGKHSSKMETACDLIEEIRGAGDKVVVFSQFTNMTLFMLARELDKRGIRNVLHYGTGMTDTVAQKAQDDFMEDPGITAFLSSDAGAYGLNFQVAKYVINYDVPYDPDLLTQRNDRIDRADSYLEGLTSYLLITEDTVEEKIWKVNQERRAITSAVQGTVEALSRMSSQEYDSMSEEDMMGHLMLGSLKDLAAR